MIAGQMTDLPKKPHSTVVRQQKLTLPRHLAFLVQYSLVAVKYSTLLKAIRLRGGGLTLDKNNKNIVVLGARLDTGNFGVTGLASASISLGNLEKLVFQCSFSMRKIFFEPTRSKRGVSLRF